MVQHKNVANKVSRVRRPYNTKGDLDKLAFVPDGFNNLTAYYEMQASKDTPDHAAFIDQISFTFRQSPLLWDLYYSNKRARPNFVTRSMNDRHVAEVIVHSILQEIFGFMELRKMDKGINFYEQSWAIGKGYGHLCIGGQKDSILVQMTGEGCKAAKQGWEKELHKWAGWLPGFAITRLDCAHDDFEGKNYSIKKAWSDLQEGHFSARGNNPRVAQAGDWFNPEDKRGRTLYIGRRENGKLCRIYEKGKQLGDTESQWVRLEVEWHNRDRVIPLDALLCPGKYLAGAYSAFAWISEEQSVIKTVFKATATSLEHLKDHAKRCYGKLLNVMRDLGHSDHEIVQELIVAGSPASLSGFYLLAASEADLSILESPCPF